MSRIQATATLSVALALVALPTTNAEACGGFFCNNEVMDQSKERIVFAIDEQEGKVETHVQIFYQGTADEFAWIVPVPSAPVFGLSTDELFTQLEWRTAPSFNLESKMIGDCEYDWYPPYALESDAADGGGGFGTGGGAPANDDVVVVDEGTLGPYQRVTLQASNTTALLTWLQDNDYDIPSDVGKSLDTYVSDGSFFVALKLASDKDAGDIAPIKMTYEASAAMIPLILTSIAATPDMRLQPYVFSDRRAVPDNYLHVRINEAAIDWLGWGSNYDDVITQAANEAGGQAFATDYAGTTQTLRGALYREGRFDLARLRTQSDPAAYVQSMLNQGFPRSASVQEIIRSFIDMPQEAIDAGVDERSYYNCLACYPEYVSLIDFDPAAMTDALDAQVVQPLIEAESLFTDYSYLTRMTSSMSPEEMKLDPYFVLNADMGEVSNMHMATLVTDCTDVVEYSEAPRWIELADGREILVPSERWFWDSGQSYASLLEDMGAPAAIAIEDTSGSGQPVLMSDQSGVADAALDDFNAGIRGIYGLDDADPTGTPAGCGCSSNGAAGSVGWLAGLAGLLVVGRRRR